MGRRCLPTSLQAEILLRAAIRGAESRQIDHLLSVITTHLHWKIVSRDIEMLSETCRRIYYTVLTPWRHDVRYHTPLFVKPDKIHYISLPPGFMM